MSEYTYTGVEELDEENKKQVKITHIMANGEVRDSLVGYKMSADDFPEVARRIIAELFQGKR